MIRIECIPSSNSLLISGSEQSLEHIKKLIAEFDVPSGKNIGNASQIESANNPRFAHTFVIYNPKYISGEGLIAILCDFKDNLIAAGISDPGLVDTINSLKWIDKTSSLLISGDQQSVEQVQELLTKFDIPNKENLKPFIGSVDNTSFLVYKLKYHAGNSILKALHQIAGKIAAGGSPDPLLVDTINSLQSIKITNSFLCSGPPNILNKLKELIESIDIPLRQVFIEVLVIQTTLANQQNFGLQWGGQLQYLNKTVAQTGNFPVASPPSQFTPSNPSFPTTLNGINGTSSLPKGGIIPFSSGFDLGVIGDIILHKGKTFVSLGSLLNAIQADQDSTILLNPKIITQDNRQSTIFSGQNLPYTGALIVNTSLVPNTNTSSQPTTTNLFTANVEYMEVGATLTITPILGDGDIVTMSIIQDVSVASGGITSATTLTPNTTVNGIQTERAHMETRVHVPNNHFVALSGMINDTKTHFKTGIPCLGGLPVIGTLFSENDRSATKNNIIIFVRPQIINSIEEFEALTEHQEWLYEDNARIIELKNEFIEGLDMIKP